MTHPLIVGWAREKFKIPEGLEIRLRSEEPYHSGCPTCGDFSGAVYIEASSDGFKKNITYYGYYSWGEMIEILEEVLTWSVS